MCRAHASQSANVGLGLHDKLLQPQSARAYDSIQVYKGKSIWKPSKEWGSMENLNPHDMRCLDWSVQNYDKVHWLPHPSAAVFPHQNDVKVQNCKRRLSDGHQYSNCKCQTRWFSSASYGKSQWAALDQRLLRASSETLARYCASDSINSSSTQDQRKGLHWATWPDQSKGTQHHITLSPQFAQDWDSETSTIRTKRIIKNGQEKKQKESKPHDFDKSPDICLFSSIAVPKASFL